MKTNLSTKHLAEIFSQGYNLHGKISRLSGENQNYQITTPDGQRFVLKLAGQKQPDKLIELEQSVTEFLHLSGVSFDFPRLVPTQNDDVVFRYSFGDQVVRACLWDFITGTPWGEHDHHSSLDFINLGRALGELDTALEQFDHPVAHRTHVWDLAAAPQHRHKITLVNDPARRRILEWAFHLYAAIAWPQLPHLPHSVIHGDANDENVLLSNGCVSAFLDFGDCLYNPTICELAIALAYAMLDQDTPLDSGAEVVQGYHAVHPLSKEELAVLFPLVCGRLATTVTMAAARRQINPRHPSWFVTEDKAWSLLEKLSNMDPVKAENILTPGEKPGKRHTTKKSIDRLIDARRRHIGASLSLAYEQPLKIVRGVGQYLFDHRGRPYLDMVNNVCHVGHCHPRVVAAGQRQMAILNTNTRYLYDGLTEYAERLCATLPEPLDTCFFVNSGSEANELAIRLAMAYTGRRDFLVIDGAYHGHTSRLIELSPYKFLGPGGTGRAEEWVHIVPMPDGYRGRYKGRGLETGVAYGAEVGWVIAQSQAPIAAFLAEPLMGCGGQIIPPEGYLKTAFQHVRAAGGLCIIDEVQVGFGRVGSRFWAFELQDVIPDIVTLGKPIGNGHPMAAVITRRDIAAAFANGMEFFSTFGGNPVSCAIGMAVLDVIRDEKLQENALQLGERLQSGFRALMEKYPLIGDVRGAGLFIGVELVQDRTTLKPAARMATRLVNQIKQRGILLSTDGPLHNVIKIKPPMVLTADDVEMVLRIFEEELVKLG